MPKIIDKLKEPSKTIKASTDLTEASKLVSGVKDILNAFKELKTSIPQAQQNTAPAPLPAPLPPPAGISPSVNMAQEMNAGLKNAKPEIVLREDKIEELMKSLFSDIPDSMGEDTLKSVKEKANEFIPLIKPKIKEAILQTVKIEYVK